MMALAYPHQLQKWMGFQSTSPPSETTEILKAVITWVDAAMDSNHYLTARDLEQVMQDPKLVF